MHMGAEEGCGLGLHMLPYIEDTIRTTAANKW